MIRTGETAIDYQHLAIRLNGILTLIGTDRDMSVDDMRMWPRLHAELFKNAVTHLSLVAQSIVMPFVSLCNVLSATK